MNTRTVRVVSVLLLLGALTPGRYEGADKKKVRLPTYDATAIHNLKVTSIEHWTVSVWTDGATVFPLDPVAVSVRFVADRGKKPDVTALIVRATLPDGKIRIHRIAMRLIEREASIQIYEFHHPNMLPADDTGKKSLFAVSGDHEIAIELVNEKETIAEFTKLTVKVVERKY